MNKMESSSIRGASDVEQTVWSCSVTAECKPVKEEPEWGEYGVSEAAVVETSYVVHKVKEEVAYGPELVQKQDIAFSIRNAPIKNEGPCKPEPPDEAKTAPECTHTCRGDGSCCNESTEQQHKCDRWIVKIDPIKTEDPDTSNTDYDLTLAPCKLEPVKCNTEDSAAKEVIASYQPHLNNPHTLEQKYSESCSVSSQDILLKDKHTCSTCNIICNSKLSLNNHSSVCPGNDSIRTSLKDHNETTRATKILARNRKSKLHSGDKRDTELTIPSDLSKRRKRHTIQKPFSCDICGKCFTRKTNLSAHIKLHTDPKYCCDICNRQFTHKGMLVNHRRTHIIKKTYNCDICNKQFLIQSAWIVHMRMHTGERPYSCDTCNKRFMDRSTLTRHAQIHTGEKLHCCEICNKSFTDRSTLTKHRRIHMDEKLYSCNVCNKEFTDKSSLTRHIRIHTGEKPFSCDVCHKQFTHNTTLIRHVRIHTGEKPYSCDTCDKKFTDHSTWTNHRRTHTDEKLYSCDICNKRFKQKAHLTVHTRIHTGEKPFCCDVCDKRFFDQSTLKSHVRVHTGEKPFCCDICNKRFRHKSTFAYHKRTH